MNKPIVHKQVIQENARSQILQIKHTPISKPFCLHCCGGGPAAAAAAGAGAGAFC